MKHLLVILLSVQLAFAVLDYQTPSPEFSATGCQGTNEINSPIDIIETLCAPYSHFEISLNNIDLTTTTRDTTRQQATGAPTFKYSNQGTLEVNGTTWRTVEIAFRYQAEHKIAKNEVANYEMQILLAGTGATAGKTGVLSFLIRKATNQAQKQALTKLPIFSSSGPGQLSIDFPTLTEAIQKKLENDIYLNLWTYEGTLTYPTDAATPVCTPATWYIYGSELYIDTTTTVGSTIENWVAGLHSATVVLTTTLHNARPTSGVGGGSGERKAERLCYTGFFRVTMGDNYGLWFGVTIIFFFFVLLLVFGEKPITDPEYRETTWTHHPLVSLYTYGNELHTRKTRAALFMATLTLNGMFSSVWYENCDADKRERGSNTIVYGVYSMILSVIITHFIGYILRTYYVAKYQFHKTRDEKWDQRAQNRIFGYYFCIFFITVVGWSICVWKMNGLHAEISNNASRMWVASFFIGLALEWLIVDPIMCLLGRSIGFFRDLIKLKGYMYDNKMHETYMLFLKQD